jgi:hypothetical protein
MDRFVTYCKKNDIVNAKMIYYKYPNFFSAEYLADVLNKCVNKKKYIVASWLISLLIPISCEFVNSICKICIKDLRICDTKIIESVDPVLFQINNISRNRRVDIINIFKKYDKKCNDDCETIKHYNDSTECGNSFDIYDEIANIISDEMRSIFTFDLYCDHELLLFTTPLCIIYLLNKYNFKMSTHDIVSANFFIAERYNFNLFATNIWSGGNFDKEIIIHYFFPNSTIRSILLYCFVYKNFDFVLDLHKKYSQKIYIENIKMRYTEIHKKFITDNMSLFKFDRRNVEYLIAFDNLDLLATIPLDNWCNHDTIFDMCVRHGAVSLLSHYSTFIAKNKLIVFFERAPADVKVALSNKYNFLVIDNSDKIEGRLTKRAQI